MRDEKVSLPRAMKLHPSISKIVIDTIEAIEAKFPDNTCIRIVQGLRTIEEQNTLYAQGRTLHGAIITNAKGGRSFHNYGLAFDFAMMYDKDGNGSFEVVSWDINYDFDKNDIKDWQQVVAPFKALGFTWGGDFKNMPDSPHLEKKFGYSWQQLYAKYAAEDFIPNTRYVKL